MWKVKNKSNKNGSKAEGESAREKKNQKNMSTQMGVCQCV